MKKQIYVCGFLFDFAKRNVLLIEKRARPDHPNRPAFMDQRLNGIGGLANDNETPYQAMSRKYQEETGIAIDGANWRVFHRMSTPEAIVVFFAATMAAGADNLFNYKSKTDEPLKPTFLPGLSSIEDSHILPEMKWLIPMAAQVMKNMDKPDTTGFVPGFSASYGDTDKLGQLACDIAAEAVDAGTEVLTDDEIGGGEIPNGIDVVGIGLTTREAIAHLASLEPITPATPAVAPAQPAVAPTVSTPSSDNTEETATNGPNTGSIEGGEGNVPGAGNSTAE